MKRTLLWTATGLLLVRCGGGGGSAISGPGAPSKLTSPSPSPSAASAIPAGMLLTVVSGETDQPVADASVAIGGRTLRSDPDGRIVLPETVGSNTPVEIVAAGFLDRVSLLRSATSTRYTLWPRGGPSRLDEGYTATLVYTSVSGAGAASASSPLERLPPLLTPFLLPSAEIRSDPAALAAHRDAVNALNAAILGQIVYVLVSERPASGAVFESLVDPGDKQCGNSTRAITSVATRGAEISGGRIVFCSSEASRSSTVTHELGHTFGLQHSPDPQELMNGFFGRTRNTGFSDREALAMRLMLQRRGGNRYPDNDREATVSSERTRTIVCH